MPSIPFYMTVIICKFGISESNQEKKKTLKTFVTGHLILGISYKGDMDLGKS